MVALISFLLNMVASPFKSKSLLEAENAALRHQLIVLQRKVRGRVPFTNSDRLFFGAAVSLVSSLPGKYPQLMNPPRSETEPGQLVIWGKSTICSVDAFGYKFQWTTNSSKHIPFDWTGP